MKNSFSLFPPKILATKHTLFHLSYKCLHSVEVVISSPLNINFLDVCYILLLVLGLSQVRNSRPQAWEKSIGVRHVKAYCQKFWHHEFLNSWTQILTWKDRVAWRARIHVVDLDSVGNVLWWWCYILFFVRVCPSRYPISISVTGFRTIHLYCTSYIFMIHPNKILFYLTYGNVRFWTFRTYYPPKMYTNAAIPWLTTVNLHS